ncbi:MAG: NAD-dependent epimerase/dehydratase family protein [Muribaculaceae bacterium]|nr:NAD-dependent epimerase/dehydratase family protein [Muribaculaceae bacterium]
MRKIFLTGATGVMGQQTLHALLSPRMADENYEITVLARSSKINRKKLAPFRDQGVKVIWGDLTNPDDIEKGVQDADIVLHVGGLVSPAADWVPEKTLKVNTESMANIIASARRSEKRGREVRVVYIGSVSQYGWRPQPFHWGRVGDPLRIATFDNYALSKNLAERMLSESGLKYWVSLRQTGIMHPGILTKASDPISFHVPQRGVLEWVTDEDSGRLLAEVSRASTPDRFWRNFWNIGGGKTYRKSNYDFMVMTMGAVGTPGPKKVFDYNWFASRNFHGIWYEDSDELDEMFHYRSGETFKEYMDGLKRKLPFYFRLAPLAPAFLIKAVMKGVAKKELLGPLRWIEDNDEERIKAAWGSRESYDNLPSWDDADLREPSNMALTMMHGYDEAYSIDQLDLHALREAAEFRGGKLLTEEYVAGDIYRPLEWECAEGHRFRLSPWSMLRGGHWCEECLREQSVDPEAIKRQAKQNPYLAQGLS